jgi:hypothetical protein
VADDPRELADNAETIEQARALQQRFLGEMASPNLTNEQAANLDDAINELEAEWGPDLGNTQPAAPRRARRRRGASGESSSRPARRGSGGSSSRERAPGSARARGGRTGARGGGGGGPLFSPRVRGYFRRTGLPGAASTGTDIALSAIGGSLGLILLYLFIANRRGNRALASVITGVSNALQHLVEPVDPLRPIAKRVNLGPGRVENLKTHVIHGPPPAGPQGPMGPRGKAARHAVGTAIGGG